MADFNNYNVVPGFRNVTENVGKKPDNADKKLVSVFEGIAQKNLSDNKAPVTRAIEDLGNQTCGKKGVGSYTASAQASQPLFHSFQDGFQKAAEVTPEKELKNRKLENTINAFIQGEDGLQYALPGQNKQKAAENFSTASIDYVECKLQDAKPTNSTDYSEVNGKLSPAEVGTFFRKDKNSTTEANQYAIEQFDSNGDASLDAKEMSQAILTADADKNGIVTQQELNKAFKKK